jgi:hypothetical protein
MEKFNEINFAFTFLFFFDLDNQLENNFLKKKWISTEIKADHFHF